MYFGGTSNSKGFRVDALLVCPRGAHTPISAKLDFEVTNNVMNMNLLLLDNRLS